MASVRLKGITHRYQRTEVLRDITLDIEDGELMVIVGPSGCGKSTLLRIIAGLERPSGGDVEIDGVRVNDVEPAQRGVAMVFQNFALYPHMTAAENMGFALRNLGTSARETDARVRETARLLQLEPLLDRLPGQMSGGQRQRVAIGRALVRNPRIFLFDEPLSSLDAQLRIEMRAEIARLHQRFGSTMVYVTHDQVEAMTLADRIAILNAGKLEQVGAPLDLYRSPRNLFVARFLGAPRMNLLEGELASASAAGAEVRVRGGPVLRVAAIADRLAANARVTLGIRPEHLRPGPSAGDLEGQVSVVERLGDRTLVHLDLDIGAEVLCEDRGESPIRVGERVHVHAPAGAFHLFDESGIALPRIVAA
ncbi:ABC transporter ATP-binding protein [Polyangium sp. y55x31]|uniref:ABC transporter ATP-binding protein n=1 Tax=Polyangium sp. y55x31 TaxID=3042688 RepID=UPI002482F9E6|nr:ABC transporter ATP-binding protein [Polyangium sp. y55x31]MDI1475419.1 ABC transporter ATP-binding protein [Polyangium sp. y55x31]